MIDQEVSDVPLCVHGNVTLKGDAGVLAGVLLFSSVVAGSCLLFF